MVTKMIGFEKEWELFICTVKRYAVEVKVSERCKIIIGNISFYCRSRIMSYPGYPGYPQVLNSFRSQPLIRGNFSSTLYRMILRC